MHSFKKLLTDNWQLILIIVAAGLLLAYKIDKPFWGHHDWNGVYWGNVARNYFRYGFLETKLAMSENVGFVPVSELAYNFHYSPLFPITESIFLFIVGIHEWVYRLMAALFSLGTLAVFYLLVKKFYSQVIAAGTLLFWITTPMFIYFGKMPVHEPMVLFFSVLAVYLYLVKKSGKTTLAILLAELTSWPGYFLVPAISLHWFLTDKGRRVNKTRVLGFWLVSFAAFLSLILHDNLVTGSPVGGGLAEIFFTRVQGVNFVEYVTELMRWMWTYYTLLIPFSVLFIFLAWRRKIIRADIPMLFMAFSLIYPIIFRDASFRHDYLLIYFLPFLTLASALALKVICKKDRVFLAVVIIICVSAIALRFKFILALENSDIYKESVRLGKFINNHSSPGDTVEIKLLDPSVGFDGWFIAYYADRTITDKNPNVIVEYLPGGGVQYQRVR